MTARLVIYRMRVRAWRLMDYLICLIKPGNA
jgi:hypothetical protein